MEIYSDRSAAGRKLAARVVQRGLRPPLVVLGLPRGGLPVAQEVARALAAPLDVLIVRKIGFPGQPELAVGAIATGGVVVDGPLMRNPGLLDQASMQETVRRERRELDRRESAYRSGMPPLDLSRKTVVLVDDGLATGSTMLAAMQAARRLGAAGVVCAAPVASMEAAAQLAEQADALVVLQTPPHLMSIGEWYDDFRQLDDGDVRRILAESRAEASQRTDAARRPPQP